MKYIPYIFVLFAAILWGTTGTLQTYLKGEVSATSVAAFRSLIGGGVLFVVLVFMKKIKFQYWSWKWTLIAALFIGLFQIAFFTSIRLTGVAVGTVVTIGSSPIFAGLFEWILFKYKPDRNRWIATMITIIGVILLFTKNEGTEVHFGGVLIALCAGIFFALYTNFSKKLMEKEATLPAVAMIFTICALFLLPFALKDGVSWLATSTNFGVILTMAIFATTIAYILFLNGLKKIPSSSAVTLSLAEPLTASLLGVFVLREHLNLVSWLGIALILSGIITLTLSVKNATDTR